MASVRLRSLQSVLLIGHLGQDARKEGAKTPAIEERDDRLVSTMRKYVEALGGKLRLQAVFEGGKVLEISE